MIQIEGRWSSDAVMVYLRAHMQDIGRVSGMFLVDEVREFIRQPGKGLGGGRIFEGWETRLLDGDFEATGIFL